MTKSILKHKIQTLTGKSIKTMEEEMGYVPKNPDEPSMDVDTMRKLASSLVLMACNELPNYPVPAPVAASAAASSASASRPGNKRAAPADDVDTAAPAVKKMSR